MDEQRLAAIEERLKAIEAALGHLVAAWDRFAPLVERWGKRFLKKAADSPVTNVPRGTSGAVKPW